MAAVVVCRVAATRGRGRVRVLAPPCTPTLSLRCVRGSWSSLKTLKFSITAQSTRSSVRGGRSLGLSLGVCRLLSRDRVSRTCCADGSRARSELSVERGTPLSTRFAPRPVRGECECEWRGRRGPALSPALRTHARDHTHTHTHTPHTYTHTRHTSTPSHVTPTLHYVFFRVPTLAIYVEKSRQIPFRLETVSSVKCLVSRWCVCCVMSTPAKSSLSMRDRCRGGVVSVSCGSRGDVTTIVPTGRDRGTAA
ncbi:unnamed protein product [Danaus chrysippus]|uniref:(African queen) hypothetical protein n=1 Tax=Danaus chrysippus TaxID=151541 RepID=A0A8J2QSR3_9NEOP|nr:unnamed protein product [Danaus chrysippus]